MRRASIALAALAMLPGIAQAQAYSCSVPAGVPRPHPDLPDATQPRRVLPTGGYTLAISWAPQFCHFRASDPSAAFECGGGNRFGFTLHGLWPDGTGKTMAAILPADGHHPAGGGACQSLRDALGATPPA